MGWWDWSWWMRDWRWGRLGGLERSMAETVTPVPPGTALHQLCSVPPRGRDIVAGVS
ncbi:hypothetical protein Hanom_Chr01g00026721 [Helianthus anomalus]